MVGASQSVVQTLCASVFSIALSQGAIQKRSDRVSEAIGPHYTTMGEVARTSWVHYSDETSWLLHGDRQWLWGMANPSRPRSIPDGSGRGARAACARAPGKQGTILSRQPAIQRAVAHAFQGMQEPQETTARDQRWGIGMFGHGAPPLLTLVA